MSDEEFKSSQPIYKQLVQRICKQIVRGELSPQEKLPSVRELAIVCRVNPNTVQRVYTELERMNVVVTKRGQGTFVTGNEEHLLKIRDMLIIEAISLFVGDMNEMGFTYGEILKGLEDHFRMLYGSEDGVHVE